MLAIAHAGLDRTYQDRAGPDWAGHDSHPCSVALVEWRNAPTDRTSSKHTAGVASLPSITSTITPSTLVNQYYKLYQYWSYWRDYDSDSEYYEYDSYYLCCSYK